MPSNSRADNQYYGKFFEQCVVAQINHEATPIPWKNYPFTEQEKIDMMSQAKIVADFLNVPHATWIGDKTNSESGDIFLDDGKRIEIKRVSNNGNGTYHNTSINYLSRFGFDFKSYMKKYDLYSSIKILGFSPKENRMSPVTKEISSLIRHDEKLNQIYTENVIPVDTKMREALCSDIVLYFRKNPESLYQFYLDMINKVTSRTKSIQIKTIPDKFLVFNYKKNQISDVDILALKNAEKIESIRDTPKGMVLNGDVRFAFSWQNGVGLNNPTIRVFI